MKLTIGNKIKEQAKGAERNVFTIKSKRSENGEKKVLSDMTEIKSKRGQRSKYFSDTHERMRAEFYGSPIHYYDNESGEYKDLDNTFIDNGETLETKANTFKSRFNKKMKDGKIFEMEKDLCKVGLKSLDVARRGNCQLEACACDGDTCYCNKLLVKNVSDNTDIEYTVTPDRIKENIIVKQRADKYEYEFSLSLENISIGVSEDGNRLELIKKDSGMLEFYIPAPVMFDANGNSSDAVYYEIEQENTEDLKIKVIADAAWVNDSNRAFPVTIDPEIVTAEQCGAYYYTSSYEDSIFRYTLVEDDTRKGGDLRLYYNASTQKNITSEITILKSKLPAYLLNNYQNVSLKLKAHAGSTINGFSVGYSNFSGDQTEFLADVTYLFSANEDEVTIPLSNYYYRGDLNENDIYFNPPTLLIEFQNHIVSIEVAKGPNKTDYLPGDKFDPEGMVVHAIYEDGSLQALEEEEFTCYPSGALATYDNSIKIKHINEPFESTCSITVAQGEYWFNDRRANDNMENVYVLTPVYEDGIPTKEAKKYMKIELADGVGEDVNRQGTPLNAETFNKVIKVLKDKGIL